MVELGSRPVDPEVMRILSTGERLMSTSGNRSRQKENTAEGPLRRVEINLHDLKVAFWQDDPWDPSYRTDVFDELIRHLRLRGWTVGPDNDVRKRCPSLARTHRRCRKGVFHATLNISGRSVTFEAWAETWPKENQNGHRYDFGKSQRLGFLDRLRFQLERRRIIGWAQGRFSVTITDRNLTRGPHGDGLNALEFIAKDYAESCHVLMRPGWPKPSSYGNTSFDGCGIGQGDTVWLRNRTGRWLRGRAYFALNNMWHVVLGPYEVECRAASELYVQRPEDVREKHNPRRRRDQLERELTRAIRTDDFTRAALLKRILFGEAPVYRIYKHGDGGAFYGPNCSGYTGDFTAAGRYTREEAEREVLRVPHLLTLVCPDGTRIRGDQMKVA